MGVSKLRHEYVKKRTSEGCTLGEAYKEFKKKEPTLYAAQLDKDIKKLQGYKGNKAPITDNPSSPRGYCPEWQD